MRHAKPAESLIETMVAITVIVLATTAALSVLRTSQAGNEVIGKKVIAINLAEEGLEALRNLRDTNYLLFASDPDECWNKLEVTDVADCPTAMEITDGEAYYLTRDFDSDPVFKWHLTELTDAGTQGYLDLYSIDLNGDGNGEANMYAQSHITTVPDMSAPVENREMFQRIIGIDYPAPDYYDATATIYWYDHGVRQTLSLTRSIAHVY
ncbi:MAG: type II secretion system protein [Candidatus Gracilibacteria bacterium]